MCFNSKVTCWRVVHIEGRSVGRNPRVENLTTSIETETFTSHNKIMSFFFFSFFFFTWMCIISHALEDPVSTSALKYIVHFIST